MSKFELEGLSAIDGLIGGCLVDSDSGMMMGVVGNSNSFNFELAAAGNTEVVRYKRRTIDSLGLRDRIEDILISLEKQYHLIRPLETNNALFLYVVLERSRANLGLARHELKNFEKTLGFQRPRSRLRDPQSDVLN